MKFSLSLLLIALTILVYGQTNVALKTGFAFSPADFPNYPAFLPNIPSFYNEVANNTCNNGVVLGNTLWYDSYATAGQVPGLAQNISANQPMPYPFNDMYAFVFFHYPDSVWLRLPQQWTPNNFSNTTVRSYFLNALKSYAQNYQPATCFIGNEVNFYLEMDSADYCNFATFYAQAYDTIKLYSPLTAVGTIFNYEHLSGKGQLTGWTNPHWNALHDLDTSKIEVIGLTLYPFFHYQNSSLVPANYLDELIMHTGNKAIAITETGWPADSTFATAPWACSVNQQVNYVNQLFDSIIANKNISSINWLFLNYLMSNANTGYQIFRSVSMRDSIGNNRPALSTWLNKCLTLNAYSITPEDDNAVFPNPVQDVLYLNEKTEQVILFNTLGTEQPVTFTGEQQELDVKGLKSGIYFYKAIKKDQSVSFGKIIKF